MAMLQYAYKEVLHMYGAETTWHKNASQTEIDACKRSCLVRLGLELLPHLLNKSAQITITEEEKERDFYGVVQVVYTLRASTEHHRAIKNAGR